MMGQIYGAFNTVTHKWYVGLTVHLMHDRRLDHHRSSKNGSTLYFHLALRKYGFESFDWVVFEDSVPKDKLCEKEIEWIKQLNSKIPNGYNLTDGGENVNPSVDTRKKISEFMKIRFSRPEERTKQSERIKKLYENTDKRKQQSERLMGRVVPEEVKEKIRNASKGKQYCLGYKHTEQAKKNMGNSRIGSKRGEETKRRMRLSQIERWKRRKILGLMDSEETRIKKTEGQRRRREREKLEKSVGAVMLSKSE